MKIRTTQHYSDIWTAVDDDTYDGLPDPGSRRQHEMGHGKTEAAAVEDLMERVQENDLTRDQHLMENT